MFSNTFRTILRISLFLVLIILPPFSIRSHTSLAQEPLEPTPTPEVLPSLMTSATQPETITATTALRGIDPDGFVAKYYDFPHLVQYLFTRTYTPPIDFVKACWGEGIPYTGCKLINDIPSGANYSVSWQGNLITPATGQYTFSFAQVDDGARLFIDGNEIMDQGWYWPSPEIRPSPQTINLTAGVHSFRVDYEQRIYWLASLQVRWQGPGFGNEVIPSKTTGEISKLLNVPQYMQGIAPFTNNSPYWEGHIFDDGDRQSMWCGDSPHTMAECGCSTTSIAMVLYYMGATIAPLPGPALLLTDPGTVNAYFKRDPHYLKDCYPNQDGLQPGWATLGYTCGDVNFPAVGKYTADAYRTYGTQQIVYVPDYSYIPWNANTFRQEIDANTPVILKEPGHFIVGTGYIGNTFTINDPYYSDRTRLEHSAYGNKASAIIRYIRTASDFSFISVGSGSNILVTDPNGNRTGFDSVTSTILEEIPNSEYVFSDPIADPSGENPPPHEDVGIYWLRIGTPIAGRYLIQVESTTDNLYNFALYSYDKDADYSLHVFEAQPQHIANPIYEIYYSPVPEDTNLILNTQIDIKPGSDPNSVLCKNSKGIIPVAILSTVTFDALSINDATVNFNGAQEVHMVDGVPQRHEEDVNGDGKLDLVFHFKLGNTNLTCDSSQGSLRGNTFDGLSVEGVDNIRMIK